MRIRGLLAVLIISTAVIYYLFVFKAGKTDELTGDIEAFLRVKIKVTKTNMKTLARVVELYIAREGKMPDNMGDVGSSRPLGSGELDAWGTKIKLETIGDNTFRLISAGPDGAFYTDDDIKMEF